LISNMSFIQSYPIKVAFAGWESDTYTLSKSGWEVAFSQDRPIDTSDLLLRVVFRHDKLKLLAVTDPVPLDRAFYLSVDRFSKFIRDLTLNVGYLGNPSNYSFMTYYNGTFNLSSFKLANCVPQAMEIRGVDIFNLSIFREVEKPKIYVPQRDISKLMDTILSLQASGNPGEVGEKHCELYSLVS